MLSTAEASLGWSSVLNVLHDMTVKVASWPDRLIMPSAEEARLRNAVAVCEKQLEDRVATWQHLLQQQVRTQVTCSYVQCCLESMCTSMNASAPSPTRTLVCGLQLGFFEDHGTARRQSVPVSAERNNAAASWHALG